MYYYPYNMKIISVRLEEEEKKELMKYGPISQVVKQSLRLFLNDKKRAETLEKLSELQSKNIINIKSTKDLELIREDRAR